MHPSELHRWRHELEDHGEKAFSGVGKKRAEESWGYLVTAKKSLAFCKERSPLVQSQRVNISILRFAFV